MYFQTRARKYNNVPSEYKNTRYRSKLEARKAYELDMLKKAGEIKGWEYEKESIDLKVYGTTIAHYRPDFWVYHNDNSVEILEMKGFWTREALMKWKHFEAQYSHDFPEIKLTLEKQ